MTAPASPAAAADGAAWPPALPGTPIAGYRGALRADAALRGRHAEASGIIAALPLAVAVPGDARDVAALLRWAGAHSLALIPRGAGTGMPGGNVGHGVAVDLVTRFRPPPLIDPLRATARVGPGTTLAELNAAAAPHGLHFPVDPSSGDRCTLGGMIANNSGGSHTVRYGSTRRWVQALEVVLPEGAVVTTRRGEAARHPRLAAAIAPLDRALAGARGAVLQRWPPVRKNASGYALREYLESGDAVDLLVGSEGTLAPITSATLRLAPLPKFRGLALLEFSDLAAAGGAVHQVLALDPSACEMIDRTFIDLVRAGDADPGYPLREGLEAILFVEMEGDGPAEVAARLEALQSALAGVAERVSLALDAADQERYWHVRHAASPLIARLAGNRISMQFIEDGVVPVERLADYIRLLRRVLDEAGLPAVIFGHAGDANLHVNPLVDVTRRGWRAEVEEVIRAVAEGVAELGGTMTGEHGDGRLRAPLLETIWGAEMVGRFRALKDGFDPAGILNPGVILPLPGQRPLDGVRFPDPPG